MTKSIKKIIIFLMIIFIFFSFLHNVFYISFGKYITSNFVIRDYFFNENIHRFKGTHDEAYIKYHKATDKYKNLLITFDFKTIYKEFKKLNNIDISKTAYRLESEIINHLINLSKESHTYKKNSLLYFPRNFNTYWQISCDIGMISLLGPAISNIAVINGLPFYRNIPSKSCYGKFNDYGFGEYKINNIYARPNEITLTELCKEAKSKNFYRIIRIDYDIINDNIKKDIFICNKT